MGGRDSQIFLSEKIYQGHLLRHKTILINNSASLLCFRSITIQLQVGYWVNYVLELVQVVSI